MSQTDVFTDDQFDQTLQAQQKGGEAKAKLLNDPRKLPETQKMKQAKKDLYGSTLKMADRLGDDFDDFGDEDWVIVEITHWESPRIA